MYRVFLVAEGLSLTEDVSPTASVQSLQSLLGSKCGVKAKEVILLSTKGQLLDSRETLGAYDAGTEEKPVFVFLRPDSTNRKSSAILYDPYKPNPSLIAQLNRLSTTPSTTTLQQHLVVAKMLSDEAIKICNHIYELRVGTRLQYRGWQAMIGNFKSIHKSFEKHHRVFKQCVSYLQESRPVYEELLTKSTDQLEVLKKINLSSSSLGGDVFGSHDGSLYDWISSQDERSSLQDLVRECNEALSQINESALIELQSASSQLIILTDNSTKTDAIKDLLVQLSMDEINRLTQEQQSVAQSLQSTIQRAVGSGDAGALANVCLSNHKLVQLMYTNHRTMEDKLQELEMSRRAIKETIDTGLRSVASLQQRMIESNSQLLFYSEHLQLTRRRFEVLEQICASPQTLSHIVNEIQRRKQFKQEYTQLAERVAARLESARQAEKLRRQKFLESYSQHFLLSLFPSFTDRIPHYVNTSSQYTFDDDLCKLSNEMLNEMLLWLPQIVTPIPQDASMLQCDRASQTIDITTTAENRASSAIHTDSKGTQCVPMYREVGSQSAVDLITEFTQTVRDVQSEVSTQTSTYSGLNACVQTLQAIVGEVGIQVDRARELSNECCTQTDRTGAADIGLQTVGVAHFDSSVQTTPPSVVVDSEVQTSLRGVVGDKGSQTIVLDYSNMGCQTNITDNERLLHAGSQTDKGSGNIVDLSTTGSQTVRDHFIPMNNTGSQTHVIIVTDDSVQTLSSEYSNAGSQTQPNGTHIQTQTIATVTKTIGHQTELNTENIGLQTMSPGCLATASQTDLIGRNQCSQTALIDLTDISCQTEIEVTPPIEDTLMSPILQRQPSESAFWVVNSPSSSGYVEETDSNVLKAVIQTGSHVTESEPTTSPTNSLTDLEGQVVALKAALSGLQTQLMSERNSHTKELGRLEREMKRIQRSTSIGTSNETQEVNPYTVSVGSLKVGDTAVFIQDGHSNFLALTCDGRMYYLNHSSAETFKHDISSRIIAPMKRKAVIGVVTEKLLVEVRKENNRLKVPIGQRLYKLTAQEMVLPSIT